MAMSIKLFTSSLEGGQAELATANTSGGRGQRDQRFTGRGRRCTVGPTLDDLRH